MDKKDLLVGQRVALTLDEEKVVGVVKRIESSYLRLKEVISFETQEHLAAENIYFFNDIRGIAKLKDVSSTKTSQETASRSDLLIRVTNARTRAAASSSLISEKQICRNSTLQTLSKIAADPVYIKQLDNVYFEALKDLKSQRFIGVVLENSDFGRECRKLSVLTMSTEQKCYIFDLVALSKISEGLKEVLEDDWPKKVVHYSAAMIDCLGCNHGIWLRSFFDTMMAYICVTDSNEVFTIEELAHKLLKIEIKMEKRVNWYWRPLSDDVKNWSAAKALLLLELQHCLIHDHMLQPFYKNSLTETRLDAPKDSTVEQGKT